MSEEPESIDDQAKDGRFFQSRAWRTLVFVCRLVVPVAIVILILLVVLNPGLLVNPIFWLAAQGQR